MSGCQEIACTSCVHRNVCVYKDNFLKAREAVDDVMVHFESNRMIRLREIQWIKPVELQCKHYYKEVTTR